MQKIKVEKIQHGKVGEGALWEYLQWVLSVLMAFIPWAEREKTNVCVVTADTLIACYLVSGELWSSRSM